MAYQLLAFISFANAYGSIIAVDTDKAAAAIGDGGNTAAFVAMQESPIIDTAAFI